MSQTIDDILKVLKEMAENKEAVDPAFYLDASLKIMSLVGNETDKLYELEQSYAEYKASLMSDPEMTAAKAKMIAEASPVYTEIKKLNAKIERIYEIVRISKARSRLASEEFKGN